MKTRLFRCLTSFILIFSIVLSICATTLAYTCSDWSKPEIDAAAEENIIPESLMDENLALRLTRQEMCDIIVHTFEKMTGTSLYPAGTAHFTDTTHDNILIAAELGIVDGYDDGTFRPNNTLTRQQFSKIILTFYRALGWDIDRVNNPVENFADYNTVSLWARDAASIVVSAGIVQGNLDNNLLPHDNTSRQQALVMMLRTYKYLMDYLGLPLLDEPTEEPVPQTEDQPTGDTSDTSSADAATTPDKAAAETAAEDSCDIPAESITEESETLTDIPTDEAAVTDEESTEVPTPATSIDPATKSSYICSTWAAAELAEAERYGIIPESLLNTNLTQKITRGEICHAATLVLMAVTNAELQPESTEHFSDTSDPMINLAYELGIVSGMTDGTFRPNNLATRQHLFQMLANLLRAAGWERETYDPEPILEGAFIDADLIADYARKPVAIMYELGVIKGTLEGKMNPTGTTTREHGLVMFLRAYQYIHPWYQTHPLPEITGPIVADNMASAVVQFALQFEGYPYVYGEESPEVGFDCSGLIWYVYRQFGYNLNRTAASLMKNGILVEYEDLRPGDIIGFWNAAHTEIGHVALYIGNNKMIHAQNTATGVCISDIGPDDPYFKRYYEARRIIY